MYGDSRSNWNTYIEVLTHKSLDYNHKNVLVITSTLSTLFDSRTSFLLLVRYTEIKHKYGEEDVSCMETQDQTETPT
jgi:hypothetical protein